MPFPKWKYRRHPEEGYFQSTLVASAEAEAQLGTDWSDDPASTGFQVRQAAQVHPSHFTPGEALHEVVTDAEGAPVEAQIDATLNGDKSDA